MKYQDNFELNDSLINELLEKSSEHDHRYVDDNLFEEFMEGAFSEFRKFVIKHNKETANPKRLAVLLRGNGKKIIIYYNNHKLWELSLTSRGAKVSFDFNHARYFQDWEKKLNELTNSEGIYNFTLSKTKSEKSIIDDRISITRTKNGVSGGSIGMISCTKDKFDENFVNNTYRIFTELIESFFTTSPTDWFREVICKDSEIKQQLTQNGTGTGTLLEKRWQHRLFFEMKNMVDGYYAYDLEFSQPYPTRADIGEDLFPTVTATKIKEIIKVNEPDMLAVKFESGKPVALALIEVKCTKSACEGNSGIEKHLIGMKAYSECEIFTKKRLFDAERCLAQYQKFGFINQDIIIPSLSGLPIERVLILTSDSDKDGQSENGAIDYYYNHCKELEEVLCGCKVIKVNGKVDDEKVELKLI